MNILITLISIYLVSTITMWLYIRHMTVSADSNIDGEDIIYTFTPFINTLAAVVFTVAFLVEKVDCVKIANAIFLIRK